MSNQITSQNIDYVINICRLKQQQAQICRIAIKRANIQRLKIRDYLSQQGKLTKNTFFLLEGQVNIVATLINGEKIVIAQIGKIQLLNLQIIMTGWINKYSIIVASSYIKFIVFQEKQTKILTTHIIPQLQQKMALREKQINKRNRQIRQQSRKKKMQQNINKLIFPNIHPPNHKKSIINMNNNLTQQISIKDIPIFSKQLKKSKRTSSLKTLKQSRHRYSQPITLQQKNLKSVNQNLLQHFHEYGSKHMQKKLQHLKSERSLSLNQKQQKQIDYSRNEKLFKQNLKNIVKRKLMFQRKHFKILTNFKNEKKQQGSIQLQVIKKYQDQNPIDNYFLM